MWIEETNFKKRSYKLKDNVVECKKKEIMCLDLGEFRKRKSEEKWNAEKKEVSSSSLDV